MAIVPPENVREVHKFIGMIQYYRDVWKRRSHILAPLTALIGECGQTKSAKKKNKKFHWDPCHQTAFDEIKK